MRIVKKTAGRNHYYVDADDGDRRIPGVTTIVKNGLPSKQLEIWNAKATTNYAVDNWAELDALPISERISRLNGGRYEVQNAAADKGSLIHSLAEQLQLGEKVEMPEGLEGYVTACVRFLDDWEFEAAWIEKVCYSETRRYVGTFDAIGNAAVPDLPGYEDLPADADGRASVLLDWTTGNGLFASKAYQLCAYRWADWFIPEPDVVEPMPATDFTLGVQLTRHGTYEAKVGRSDTEAFNEFLYIKEVARIADRENLDAMFSPPLMSPNTSTFKLVRED